MPPMTQRDELSTAENAHQAVDCAARSIDAIVGRLLLDVRSLAHCAPLGAFQQRIESLCTQGGVVSAALDALRAEAGRDPAESLDQR